MEELPDRDAEARRGLDGDQRGSEAADVGSVGDARRWGDGHQVGARKRGADAGGGQVSVQTGVRLGGHRQVQREPGQARSGERTLRDLAPAAADFFSTCHVRTCIDMYLRSATFQPTILIFCFIIATGGLVPDPAPRGGGDT